MEMICKTYVKYLSILLFLFHVQNVFSQTQKFGKISNEEFNMQFYGRDTSAAAVVLFDIGKTYFNYNTSEGGFQIIFKRHRRIKIFDKEACFHANVRIPLYDPGSVDEQLTSLKGFTYSKSGGKIEKYKLENNGIFNDNYSEDWKYVSFTMPKVTEGSIIEYSYTVQSDYITFLREWEFQSSIPTIYSEYTVEIPEFFIYQKVNQGYLTVKLKDKSISNTNVEYVYNVIPKRGIANRTEGFLNSEEVNYDINTETWVLEHAPALVEEEYITVMDDYTTKLYFQLAGTNLPRQSYRDVLSSWDEINRLLLESEGFGSRLGKGNFLNDVVSSIKEKTNEPFEQVKLAYEYVREYVNWNGKKWLFTSQSLKKTFEEKRGNSADINLLLTSLINELKITAHPVVLSTRDHGKINISMPMIQLLNYVICVVQIDNQYFLLDATDKYIPLGMLPFRCLNWKGRIIRKTNSDWIDLTPSAADETTINSYVTINEEGQLSGGIKLANKGYAASDIRSIIDKEGTEDYIDNIKEKYEDSFIIKDYNIEDIKDKNRINIKIDIESTEGSIGNLIYIEPLPIKLFDENLLKQEKRNYPVDFGITMKNTIRSTIQIPEDFVIDELPEQVMFTLPNNAGLFQFQIVNKKNLLQVVCSFKLNKSIFLPNEYQFLKQFFDSIIAKQNESIVLKRKV